MEELAGTPNITGLDGFITDFNFYGLLLGLALFSIGYVLRWILTKVADSDWGREQTAIQMLKFIVNPVSLFITSMIAFQLMGVSTSIVVQIYSAILFGIGFSMRSLIGSFADGLLITGNKFVNLGDTIEVDDLRGRVIEVGVMTITISDDEGRTSYIPNSYLRERPFRNFGLNSDRIDIIIPIPGGQVLEPALEMIRDVVERWEHAAPNTRSIVTIGNIHGDAIEILALVHIADVLKQKIYRGDLLLKILEEAKRRDIATGYTTNISLMLDGPTQQNNITLDLSDNNINKLGEVFAK